MCRALTVLHGFPVPEQAAQAALERARARTVTVRSRQEAALAAERPPALQRIAAAVPEGPLSLLRKCCGSRELKLRVVTRHQRGVRGVATGTSAVPRLRAARVSLTSPQPRNRICNPKASR